MYREIPKLFSRVQSVKAVEAGTNVTSRPHSDSVQVAIVSDHVLISWTHTCACNFGDAVRCVRSANQNMAAYNRLLILHIAILDWVIWVTFIGMTA